MIETPKISDPSLVYMYGLSDFWVDMFSDSTLVETLLAGETLQLGEAYSYFLQRAAGISLADVQEKYDTRIKLLLLGEEDLVDPTDLSEFRVDTEIVSMNNLSNRPVLPTQTLTDGIHYDIIDGVLKLYKPIDELKFPIRYTSDGKWQYAIWMNDVEINDKWIENSFGRLVGYTEDDAIFNYKSFLEGVYFLYANGPNVAFIERGLNLAMGMPYARETESILEILQDSVTSNWIIFTATQQYLIPYSFRPDLSVGDVLTQGEVLSTWVEVIDHSIAGAWWYQIYLPRDVLGDGVDPIALGKAIEGSPADDMMETFLKHHMFEVLITQPSSDITAFNTARDLVLRAKPEYTYPVFVWKASVGDEIIDIRDDLTYNYLASLNDHCVHPPSVRFMDRATDDGTFIRGTSWYNRVQGSMYAASFLGYGDWPGNGGWAPEFDNPSDRYLEYLGVLMRNRGDKVSATSRGTIVRGWRGVDNENYESLTWNVLSKDVFGSTDDFAISERDLTPLYMLSKSEVITKMRTIDSRFSIVGRERILLAGLDLPSSYDRWILRNSSVSSNDTTDFTFEMSEGDLDNAFSIYAYQTYVPKRSEMYKSDGTPKINGMILLTRSTENAWVCQWVRNDISASPTLFPIEDADDLRAIEEYTFDDLPATYRVVGTALNPGIYEMTVDDSVEVNADLLVTMDGKYVSIFDYSIRKEFEQSIPLRTYVDLDVTPLDIGYMVTDKASLGMTLEETLSPEQDGTYLLTESVSKREDILVISDGDFIFDYSVSGDILTVYETVEDIVVRYVTHSFEEVFPAGDVEYTLAADEHCKIFVGTKLLEDWSIRRTGTLIELPSPAVGDVTVRYDGIIEPTVGSKFHRSTLESNRARFLMDRSRDGGEYDDYIGQTVFMNRGGTPTLSDGSNADSVKVTRRLI